MVNLLFFKGVGLDAAYRGDWPVAPTQAAQTVNARIAILYQKNRLRGTAVSGWRASRHLAQ